MDFIKRVMEEDLISRWIEFRSNQVTEVVELIRDKLRSYSPNTELSIDLYPPSTSWLVGQDYRAIGKLVDSVKIMIYSEPFNLSPYRIPYELYLARKNLPENTKVIMGLSSWPPTSILDLERDIKLALKARPDSLYFYSFGWTPAGVLSEIPRIIGKLSESR